MPLLLLSPGLLVTPSEPGSGLPAMTAGSSATHCSSSPPSLGAGQPFSVILALLGGALGSWKKSGRDTVLPACFSPDVPRDLVEIQASTLGSSLAKHAGDPAQCQNFVTLTEVLSHPTSLI